jgi:hypothetical protein
LIVLSLLLLATGLICDTMAEALAEAKHLT